MQDLLELRVLNLDSAVGARRIEAAVAEVRGVQEVGADPATQLVSVRFDDDQVGGLSISRAIEDLGYEVSQRPAAR